MGNKSENGLIDFDLDQLAKRQTLIRMKELKPMQEQITIDQIFENLSRTAPELITRKKLYELTGGILREKTLANMDCEGVGIQPRIRIGSKIFYPKDAAIAWIKQRCKIEEVSS